MDSERQARIAAGRKRHGVGDAPYFPGNVQHLVSPLVGWMRRAEADGQPIPHEDLEYYISRLSLVLDLAREQDEMVEETFS